MKTTEKTKVQAVSSTKMAVAAAFLGAAALAASAAGGAATKPDLVITGLSFKTGEQQDTVTVTYVNKSRYPVKGRYTLLIHAKPNADIADKVTVVTAEPSQYQLGPGQSATVSVAVEKVYKEEVSNDQLIAYIDYRKDSAGGYISESNETNNAFIVPFSGLNLDAAPSDPQFAADGPGFCAAEAGDDPHICKKRYQAMTDWPEGAIDTLLADHECAGVYKGFPIISDAQGYVAHTVNVSDNAASPVYLNNCSLIDTTFAASPDIVRACLDELETKGQLSELDFYLGNQICPNLSQFCKSANSGKCAARFESAGIGELGAQFMQGSSCKGIYRGLPMIEKNGVWAAVNFDSSGQVLLADGFAGCSITPMDWTGASVCIDELESKFKNNFFFADSSICYNPELFCKTTVQDDTDICEDRLMAAPGFPKDIIGTIFESNSCADVYRGMVVLQVQNGTHKVLSWNPSDNIISTQTLSGCSLANTDTSVSTAQAARNCIDQLEQKLSSDPLFIADDCQPQNCSWQLINSSEAFDLCQKEGLEWACFDENNQFFTCTNFASGCGSSGSYCKVY